jgi:hypothetical protein
MSTENEVKTNVAEVTEKIEVTEEKTVIPAVKETAEKVVEAGKEAVETVKDKVEEAVEAVKAPARSKKATWWNRILSAIIGAIMSFAATLGITSDQIAEQKARTEQIKVAVNEALTAIKKGDIAAAKTALEKAVEPAKELIDESKKVIDKTKEVVTAQQQAGTKAIEAVQTQYTTK